jgi:hypothetical protein
MFIMPPAFDLLNLSVMPVPLSGMLGSHAEASD